MLLSIYYLFIRFLVKIEALITALPSSSLTSSSKFSNSAFSSTRDSSVYFHRLSPFRFLLRRSCRHRPRCLFVLVILALHQLLREFPLAIYFIFHRVFTSIDDVGLCVSLPACYFLEDLCDNRIKKKNRLSIDIRSQQIEDTRNGER